MAFLRRLRSSLRFAVQAKRVSSAAQSQPAAPLTVLTEDETLLRETVRRFAREQVAPRVKAMDENSAMDPAVIQGLFDCGLMGAELAAEFGGSEVSFFCINLIIEELAKKDASVSVLFDVQNTLVIPLLREHGTAAQHTAYLRRLSKDMVGAFCLSEAGSGSDAFALKTSAVLDGDEWVLDGTKLWITNAGHAGLFVVFANARPDDGHRGISCFLVERHSAGLTVGKPEDKLGIRASSTCPVHLDGVRVPQANVLGQLGAGYKYAIAVLNEGRIGIASQMVGLAQGCFDATVAYLLERRQFGQRIWDFQAVRHQVANLALQIESARLLTYNAARLKQNAQPFIKEAAMAKLHAGNVASAVSSQCVELMGGVGFSREFPVEKFYRDAKVGSIYEGTSNIQLNTIAKLIEPQFR